MKVAMVSGEYPPDVGGVGDYTALLVRHLRKAGVHVRVISSRGLECASGEADTPGHARAAKPGPGPSASWGPSSWPALARMVGDADVVHLQYQAAAYRLHWAITLLPLYLRLAQPRLRVVTTFHDLRPPYLFRKAGPLRGLAVRALVGGSHAAVFTDPADLTKVGQAKSRHWIPIGSNISPVALSAEARAGLRSRLGVGKGERLVGYFGLVNASKGLGDLLAATALIREQGMAMRLVLIGDTVGSSDPTNVATTRELSNEVARLGLEGLVVHTGWLPAEEVSAHLQACDAIALPYADGVSLRRGSMIAALVHDLPIVTTSPTGKEPRPNRHDRGLRDGEHALLVPPGDDRALAAALTRLLSDDALRLRVSNAAAALGSRFSWREIAAQTVAVYGRLARVPR